MSACGRSLNTKESPIPVFGQGGIQASNCNTVTSLVHGAIVGVGQSLHLVDFGQSLLDSRARSHDLGDRSLFSSLVVTPNGIAYQLACISADYGDVSVELFKHFKQAKGTDKKETKGGDSRRASKRSRRKVVNSEACGYKILWCAQLCGRSRGSQAITLWLNRVPKHHF